MKPFLSPWVFFIVAGIAFSAELDEPGAVALLQKLDVSKATDAELFDAAAACRRLTIIGTEKSVPALEPLLADPKLGSYARTALENIKKPEAEAALKKHPSKTDNASPVSEKLVAAMKQVETIAAGGAEADTLFVKLLKSDDKTEFNAALEGFRKKPNVALLAKEQAALKPERRVAAILSLLDLNDIKPLPPEIVEAAKSDENAEVRAAAIAVLGKFPDENSIQVLFALYRGFGNIQGAVLRAGRSAMEALVNTKYADIDKIVLEKLVGDPNEQEGAIRLVEQRRIKAAEPILWKIARETQDKYGGSNRYFSYAALGRIVGSEGFSNLLGDYQPGKMEKRFSDAIFISLKTACQISADRPAYAKLIAEKLSDPAAQLELFGELGGEEALKQIAEIARKTDKDDIRDKATKILGEWTGAEVAPVILELSASLSEEKYKVRTLRGFLRAVRQFEIPGAEKKKLCEKALDVATRDEEKKMIREQLGKLKTVEPEIDPQLKRLNEEK